VPRLLRPVPLLATAAVLFAGCHSNSNGPHNANLTVVFNTPLGSIGSASISGPNSYSITAVGTTTLSGLNPGDYTFNVIPLLISDPIVSPVDTGFANPNPLNVVSNETDTTNVYYNPRPGTGGAWITNGAASGTLVQYSNLQLAAGGAPTPALTFTGPPLASATDVTVDRSGNLWVMAPSSQSVLEYPSAQLTDSTMGTPLKILLPGTPGGIAFDFAGNLWVTLPGDSIQLVEYSSLDLLRASTDGVALTPLTNGQSYLQNDSLKLMTFDGAGNLWIAAPHRGAIVEYPASVLTTDTPYPALALQIQARPTIPIIDVRGNFWILTAGDSILEYPAARIQTIATLDSLFALPSVTIAMGTNATIASAAFDNGANLWLAATTSGSLLTLTPQQMSTGGAQTPTVRLTGVTTPSGLAFDPRGDGTPLYGSHAPRVAALHH
jgi:hypothetical protein